MILAGGAGTRFWPASRRALPKHFVRLVGDETLFGETLARLRRIAPADQIWVASSRELRAHTRRAVRDEPGVRLLFEPEPRNTAAAIVWASAHVAAVAGGDAIVGIFPADHHIQKPADFARSAREAARLAADGERLILIGVEPTSPDTAYGYLQVGDDPAGGLRVERFVEKPPAARARRYFAGGRHLWNAGMVVATADRILTEARTHAPEVWDALGPVLDRIAAGRRVKAAELDRAYRRVKPLSFDFAVLERTRRVGAVRARFPWSDLGSWDALAAWLPRAGGNRVRGGPVVAVDAKENAVWSAGSRTIALLGVSGLAVIESPDALLVCPLDRAQDVRLVVEALERGGKRHLT